MPKFKNIRVKMKNGKSRLQRVQVLTSGKFKFVKNSSKSTRSKTKPVSRKKSSKSRKSRAPVKRKVNKQTKQRKSMPKKSKIPLVGNSTFKKAAAGVGTGVLLTTILSALGQGQLAQSPIVKIGGGFLGGDIVGAAASLFSSGGLGQLGLGGNGQGEGM